MDQRPMQRLDFWSFCCAQSKRRTRIRFVRCAANKGGTVQVDGGIKFLLAYSKK